MGLRWVFPLLLALGVAERGFALDSYRVNASESVFVNEHGAAYIVKNNGTVNVMVPTKTSTEWTAFRNNKPAYITLISCPANYVGIPADGVNTTTPFCAMIYEAKNVSGNPTSQATVTPWTNIDLATARSECQSLGAGYDLPTLAQWQTMAHNVENVAANWSGGTVGSGCLKMGNGSVVYSGCSYNGANPEFGTGRNALASMTLSTGEAIWDLNGNVHELIISTPDPMGIGTGISMWAYQATGTAKTALGPKGNYSSGCGGGDASGKCGLGWMLWQGETGVVEFRGGAYNNEWGIYGMHTGYTGTSDPSVGFRCVYNP